MPVLGSSPVSQLPRISLCLGTHCRFIVKYDISFSKRSRHYLTVFDEILRDLSDFKTTGYLYINIFLVVSTLLVRTRRLSEIAVIFAWKILQWSGRRKAISVSNFSKRSPTRLSSLDPSV